MERRLLLTISILYCLYSYGHITKDVTIAFSSYDFMIADEGNDFISISSNRFPLHFQPIVGSPSLPYITTNILIPNDYDYIGFSYSMSSPEIIGHQKPILYQMEEAVGQKTSPHNSYLNEDYRGQAPTTSSVIYAGSNTINGFKYLSFLISPFVYQMGILSFYQHFELKISLLQSNKIVPYDRRMKNHIMRLIYNAEDLDESYSKDLGRNRTDTIDYLLITSQALKDAFIPLIHWKKKKGIKSHLVTTEEIDLYCTADSLQHKIKKYIKDFHNSYHTKYVLLGGDIDIVPTQYCRISYNSEDKYTPCDYFYSCLDSDWSPLYNGLTGAIPDSIDLSPDIFVTRLSVESINDVNNIVNRIIKYEKGNYNHCEKILMTGKTITTGNDAELRGNDIYQYSILPYWTCERFRFYNTRTDFIAGDTILNAYNLQNEFSKGYSFIDIKTHGWTEDYSLEVGTYNTINAENLTNNGMSNIVTMSCYTNAFDQDVPCLSEVFMRNPNSGIISYWGSSREGWSYTSYYFDKEFYRFLLTTDDNHYGDIAFGTKNKFVPSSRRFKGAERWLLFSINPLGDPEMPIYTQTPYCFNKVQVSYINDSLYVNTNDNHCSICIMSDEDWGDSYYAVYKDTCEIKISVPFGKYSICVTKPNYIPYCTSLINTVYIQNENLTGNQTYLGGTIQVGSDVTPYQATGPVIIETGKTQMKALQEVFIKNNFEVQQGAELWIGPLTNP